MVLRCETIREVLTLKMEAAILSETLVTSYYLHGITFQKS